MHAVELRHTISEPWLSLVPVRVGKIRAGMGTPERYALVSAGEKLLRIDVYPDDKPACYAFEDAIIWRDLVVIGFGHSVFVVSLNGERINSIDLGGYFASFHSELDFLLIASQAHLFCLSFEADVRWKSDVLGFDGVVVDRIQEGLIFGQAEWNPPGGWLPFIVSLASGKRVVPN